MANLTRAWTWERWVPPLGDNPGDKPFFLELASGLTKELLEGFMADYEKATAPPEVAEGVDRWRAYADQVGAVLSKVARLGNEPLRIVDEHGALVFEVKTMGDFCLLALQGPKSILWELTRAIGSYNTVGGQLELFYARHSGGTGSTPAPSVVKDEGQTGGP